MKAENRRVGQIFAALDDVISLRTVAGENELNSIFVFRKFNCIN